tara:strand:+ start:396 stop:620 length:225 start_codon:yes stop_codon:yes gene_type:complete
VYINVIITNQNIEGYPGFIIEPSVEPDPISNDDESIVEGFEGGLSEQVEDPGYELVAIEHCGCVDIIFIYIFRL